MPLLWKLCNNLLWLSIILGISLNIKSIFSWLRILAFDICGLKYVSKILILQIYVDSVWYNSFNNLSLLTIILIAFSPSKHLNINCFLIVLIIEINSWNETSSLISFSPKDILYFKIFRDIKPYIVWWHIQWIFCFNFKN